MGNGVGHTRTGALSPRTAYLETNSEYLSWPLDGIHRLVGFINAWCAMGFADCCACPEIFSSKEDDLKLHKPNFFEEYSNEKLQLVNTFFKSAKVN